MGQEYENKWQIENEWNETMHVNQQNRMKNNTTATAAQERGNRENQIRKKNAATIQQSPKHEASIKIYVLPIDRLGRATNFF